MESVERTVEAQKLNPPSEGSSGLYIYRSGDRCCWPIKKDIWIDGGCVGETAPNVFFYEEVEGDKVHKISTESEFSPNDMIIKPKSGMLYFIRQYLWPGMLISTQSHLELVDEEEGVKNVINSKMAVKGTCSEEYKNE